MREISYAVKQVQAEDGKMLSLAYSILIDDSHSGPESYGVRIVEQNSGSHTEATDLTTDAAQIDALMDKLSRNTVTPTGLADILTDWL